jgi:lipopolysaccharide transport system permease protein
MLPTAFSDLRASLSSWRLWTLLGWIEIRQRYARSRLGPFWLTVSTSVMVATIGVVYSTLFGMNMHEYLPFLAIGLVMWMTFSQITTEGSVAYINGSTYIRQIATPKLIFILQVVWRNVVILGHNFIIVVALLLLFGCKNWLAVPLFIPGLVVFLLNATWIAMLLGLLSARFRDLPQIISALLQVAFYVTPILYRPNALTRFSWIVTYNPLAYLMEIVRAPLVGIVPGSTDWLVTLVMAAIGWLVALYATGRYAKRIPYWV